MEQFLYRAQSMADGKFVIGALVHIPYSPFTYIASVEAMKNMFVNELDGGKTNNLNLTRVMIKSVEPYSPFTYIASVEEAMKNTSVNEQDVGKTNNLNLTRVMIKSVEPYMKGLE